MPAGCELLIEAISEEVRVWCQTCHSYVYREGLATVPAEEVLLAMQRHIGPTAQPAPKPKRQYDWPGWEGKRPTWEPADYRRVMGMIPDPKEETK